MIMNVILWVIFGALVGWLASIIMRTNEEQGALGNIVVGIAGAFIGGAMFRAFGGEGITGFNLYSLFVAILGSVVLIFLIRMITGGRGAAPQ